MCIFALEGLKNVRQLLWADTHFLLRASLSLHSKIKILTVKFQVMAIAISDVSLKEIYNLSTEDKLDLVDMIIKSMKSAVTKAKPKTNSWVDQFEGKWQDSKDADEMVADLRASRTTNSSISL